MNGLWPLNLFVGRPLHIKITLILQFKSETSAGSLRIAGTYLRFLHQMKALKQNLYTTFMATKAQTLKLLKQLTILRVVPARFPQSSTPSQCVCHSVRQWL